MATNKSGVSEQVLSLPKGGGAIRPIGDTFKADLFTGTGSFSIPIDIPDGRNTFAPELTLAYSTGNGNGPSGLGWTLPVLSISRKTAMGIPTYNDSEDTFVIGGNDDLVPIGNGRYVPRTESLFARVEMVTANDGLPCWVITTKDGVRNVLGKTSDSRLTDPSNPDRICSWFLSETIDPNNNKIIYHYKKEDYAGLDVREKREYTQIYLSRIEYVNYPSAGEEHFLYRFELDYGEFNENGEETGTWEIRPDPFSNYRNGFEIRTLRRCRRFLIKIHWQGHSPDKYLLIRSYDLEYNTDALSQLSILTSITLKGCKLLESGNDREIEYEVSTNPSLKFGYSEFNLTDKHFESLKAHRGFMPDKPMSDADIELIDLFGNGLPDILDTSELQTYYWRNMGNGTFSGPHTIDKFPFQGRLSRGEVMLADANGNGASDLLVMEGNKGGYFCNYFEAEWANYIPFDSMPMFYSPGNQFTYLDMNADGAIDLLFMDDHSVRYYVNKESLCSEARRSWEGPRRGQIGLTDDSRITLAIGRQNLRFADMNGDGMIDLVSIYSGRLSYRPYLGKGVWGDEIVMANSPQLGRNYDPTRLFVTDINGNGFADLIYVEYDRVYYWINQSGNRWSARQTIFYTPLTKTDSVRTADMKGTGTRGLLWSDPYSAPYRSNYKYLDFTGGQKPLLLNKIDNGFGGVTTIEYAPSTKFYLEDSKAGNEWKLHLPFPVWVVANITTHDHITHKETTLEYRYHHGCYDGFEKEFRGFSFVEERELGDGDMPTVLRKNWFHPGTDHDFSGTPLDFSDEHFENPWLSSPEVIIPAESSNQREALRSLRGILQRTEIYGLDNSEQQNIPYAINQNILTVEELFSDIPKKPFDVYSPKLLETVSIKSERDDTPPKISCILQIYDQYGNLIETKRKSNSQEKPELNPPRITVLTRHRYHILDEESGSVDLDAPYQPVYMVNRPIETVDEEEYLQDGELYQRLLGHVRYYYDGDTFVGQPLEQIPIRGNLSRKEFLVSNDHLLTDIYGAEEIPQSLLEESGFRIEERDGQKWYWLQAERKKAGPYGIATRSMDGRGNIMSISYDDYFLIPTIITDAQGTVRQSIFDYQAQQTKEVTDVNGNKTVYGFDPLGRLIKMARMGKSHEQGVGDTLNKPTVGFEYHTSTVDIHNPYPNSVILTTIISRELGGG